jgi:chromosome segregation ATPase
MAMSVETKEALRIARDLETIRYAAEQGCALRNDAAATLRALAEERDEFMRLWKDAGNRALTLENDLTAARAETARLRETLEEIERGHIPSMPMTEVVDELTWAQMWVGRLRKIARVALAGDKP